MLSIPSENTQSSTVCGKQYLYLTMVQFNTVKQYVPQHNFSLCVDSAFFFFTFHMQTFALNLLDKNAFSALRYDRHPTSSRRSHNPSRRPRHGHHTIHISCFRTPGNGHHEKASTKSVKGSCGKHLFLPKRREL